MRSRGRRPPSSELVRTRRKVRSTDSGPKLVRAATGTLLDADDGLEAELRNALWRRRSSTRSATHLPLVGGDALLDATLLEPALLDTTLGPQPSSCMIETKMAMYKAVHTTPRSTTTSPLVRNSRPQTRSLARAAAWAVSEGRCESVEGRGKGQSSAWVSSARAGEVSRRGRGARGHTGEVLVATAAPQLADEHDQHGQDDVHEPDCAQRGGAREGERVSGCASTSRRGGRRTARELGREDLENDEGIAEIACVEESWVSRGVL